MFNYGINMSVIFSKYKISLLYLLALSTLASLFLITLTAKQPVDDQTFDCWIWSPNKHPLKQHCQHFYVFQGRFYSHQEQPSFEKLGLYTKAVNANAKHSLVFRVDDLIDTKFVVHHIQRVIRHWKNAGVDIQSVQIDYDSPSKTLKKYAVFLEEISEIWPEMNFSATALVSWHSDNINDLLKVSEQVDFLAFQLYQIMKPHEQYVIMSKALSSYPKPYRLGLTTHNSFTINSINKGKNFLGFSLFLGESNVSK